MKKGLYRIGIRHRHATTSVIVIVGEKEKIKVLKPRKIEISASRLELFCGQEHSLSAKVFDQNGNEMPLELEWKVQGGNLSNGTFTAGQAPGVYQIVVFEPKSKLSEVVKITIRQRPSEYKLKVNPYPLILAPGGQQKLSFKVYKGYQEVWSWPWEFKVTP